MGPMLTRKKSARLPQTSSNSLTYIGLKSMIKYIVITPNSSTFSDWRRTYHVSWVKIQLFVRLGQTKLNNSLGKKQIDFDWYVIRSGTMKRRQICVLVGLIQKSHWSRATFLAREGIHYSKKGLKIAKPYKINEEENLIIWSLQAFISGPKNRSPAFGKSLFDRCRLVGKWLCHLQVYSKISCSRQIKRRVQKKST